MKLIHRALIAAILLAVLTINPAWAQVAGPESISSITVSPDPVYVGVTVTITLDYDNDLSSYYDAALCVYFRPSGDMASWRANFPATVDTFGASYARDDSNYCPNITNYDDFYYFVADPSAIVDGDIVDFSVEVPGIDAGTKYVGFRIYSGSDCDDEANDGGADAPGGTTCCSLGGSKNKSFTVNVSTVQYVGNTDCGGNSPCHTGVGGLQDAIDALPAAGGTIYVYGAYVADEAAIGTKDIVLRPVDSSSSLNAGDCSVTNSLVAVDDTGDLTVDGLTVVGDGFNPPGHCFVGVLVGSTASGNLTVQNNATFQNWFGDGVNAGYGISVEGAGTHTISNATFSNNATGLNADAGSITVNNSTFNGNNGDGVILLSSSSANLIVQDSSLSNSTQGDGLFQYNGTVTLRGNTLANNHSYAYVNSGGTMVAYANNITGNNGGGFQASVVGLAASEAAKNWWGSHSNPAVGPTTDGSTSYAAAWTARLGADVDSWAAGVGSVSLGNAALSGGGANTGVIISFGRGSFNAPFENGVPPYVNASCSDFYDFYTLGGASWTVQLPVDTTTGCIDNVRNAEVAYYIADKGDCTTPNNPSCWDGIPKSQITVSGNNLLITGLDLSGTHIVAGDETGADPTVIRLETLDATSARNQWLSVVLLAVAIALGGSGLYLVRKYR